MFWYSLIELDFLISLIIVIVYGLFSLRCKNINLTDVYFISRLLPITFIIGFYVESCNTVFYPSIDLLVAILTSVVMGSFRNFESILLLLLAFVGNIFMLHSIDFMTFFITLEIRFHIPLNHLAIVCFTLLVIKMLVFNAYLYAYLIIHSD